MQKSTARYTIEHEKEQKIEKTELVQNFNSSTRMIHAPKNFESKVHG